MPLPASAHDACQKWATRASSLSLVRFHGNDYSAPVRYSTGELLVRGYVEQVVISCRAEVIARDRRSYEKEEEIFDLRHYLDPWPFGSQSNTVQIVLPFRSRRTSLS